MKIDETTTLAQLRAERAALGVTHLTLDMYMRSVVEGHVEHVHIAHATTAVGYIAMGEGATEAIAIDACFEDLRAKTLRRLARAGKVRP